MEATTPIIEKTEKAEKESKWYVLRVVSGKERKIKEIIFPFDPLPSVRKCITLLILLIDWIISSFSFPSATSIMI